MYSSLFSKIRRCVIVGILLIFFSNSVLYGESSTRSLFRKKKVDYQKLSTQQEEDLQKKKAVFGDGDKKGTPYKKEPQRLFTQNVKDLSEINIPVELGRIIEVYKAPSPESRLVVHIQDLHTNPEAQLNAASILELLIKDYNLDLVCSEGAEGIVDTSSVSSFPDYAVREKTARLFIDSGELTGEEYLSITKYPDLYIWGIENKDIYFQHILEFNKIMKFSENAFMFINRVKDTLERLKPKIYSSQLLEIDTKEKEYEENKTDTNKYLDYLRKWNSPAERFKNITYLIESIELEKKIDQEKVKQESQQLLMALQSILRANKDESKGQELLLKASLFKEKKIAPYQFYTYLESLAGTYLKGELDKYPAVIQFVGYLKSVNSLDTVRLFNEMEEFTYEIKDAISTNEDQKRLTKSLRHIKLLTTLFNLEMSNEELDYYLANKDDFKVGWFKSLITELLGKKGKEDIASIDFDPELIDVRMPDVEHFYELAHERDKAMIDNALRKIEERNAKVSALISGGFHTGGFTKVLKEKGYSYIVVAPYSSTEIDEENYKFLLSGKRRPLSDLIEAFKE